MTHARRVHRPVRLTALLLAVLLASACGNKGDLVLPPPEPAGGS